MLYQYLFLNNVDLNILFNVFSSSLQETFSYKIVTIENFSKLLSCFDVNPFTSFLFCKDEKIIGLFLSTIKNHIAYILGLAVKQEERNKGYGRIILQKGLSLLNENLAKEVILEVFKENKKAIELYISEGFKIKKEIFNFRIEINPSFTISKIKNLKIVNNDVLIFPMIYKIFNKEQERPWEKKLFPLLKKIQLFDLEFYTFFYNEILTGYAIISRQDYFLKLHDIFLKENDLELFKKILDLVIKDEKIIQANNIYSDDYHAKLFMESGFYIENIQLEMIREII